MNSNRFKGKIPSWRWAEGPSIEQALLLVFVPHDVITQFFVLLGSQTLNLHGRTIGVQGRLIAIEHFVGPVWIEPAEASDAGRARPLLVIGDEASASGEMRRATYCTRPSPELKPLLLARLAGPSGR